MGGVDPILFSFGPVSVSWYGICFLLGSVFALLFLWRLLRKKKSEPVFSNEEIFDLSIALLFGAIVGARIGYAIFYDFSFFARHPLMLVSPFDSVTGKWIGIAGMSAHGGALGVLIAAFLFSRRYRKPFWLVADAIALSAPIAIFFGRMGNFLLGELYGRVTTISWGMIFPLSGDDFPRHPSQLYEAFGEGIFLFLILLFLSRKTRLPGRLCLWAIGIYGGIRFVLEFFREPDIQVGTFFGFLTLGQILSIGMILIVVGVDLRVLSRKFRAISNPWKR